MNRGSRTRAHLPRRSWPLLAYLLLTLGMTYPLIMQFASAIPGDGFDGWQNYWNLWWMKIALVDQARWPFATDLLYYPTGVSLYFHTLNPFNGLLALPVQLAWGLLPAYNTVVLFAFAVGGYGAYLLALQALRGQSRASRARPGEATGTALSPGAVGGQPGLQHGAAFVAGLVYTFAPFHFAHLLGHMQVIALQWIPFFLVYLLRSVERGHGRAAGGRSQRLLGRETRLSAFFLVLVGLCDWYYVLYCLLFTLGLLVYLAGRRRLGWGAVASMGGAWLLFALALSPVLVPMLREAVRLEFMVPDPAQTRVLSADLLAFVTPQEMHPLWGQEAARWSSQFTSTTSERMVFAGYMPLFLASVAVLPSRLFGGRRQPQGSAAGSTGLWALSLLGFFLLSLGPVLHIGGRTSLLPGGGEIALPYALLHRLAPFVNISRSVSRFDVMVMLSLSVLVAFGVVRVVSCLARATRRVGGAGGRAPLPGASGVRLAAAAVGAAACLVLWEFVPVPYPMSAPDTPEWYVGLAAEEGDFAVLNLPMNWDRPGYLLYQTVHNKRLTSAYISRDDPRTLVERAPVLQSFRHLGRDVIAQDLASVAPSVLDYLGVRYVVLDNYKMPAGGSEREQTIRLAGEVFGSTEPSYSDERLTVFRVELTASPVPFLVLGEGWGARTEIEGDPWRELLPGTTVLIHSDVAADLQLRFRAEADARSNLTIWLGDAVVGGFTVATGAAEYLTGRFSVGPGDTALRLQAGSPGGRMRLSELDLVATALPAIALHNHNEQGG